LGTMRAGENGQRRVVSAVRVQQPEDKHPKPPLARAVCSSTTPLEFLRLFQLEVLHNALQAHHGSMKLNQLLQMGPADLDRMNIKSTGVRQRFFSAISIANSAVATSTGGAGESSIALEPSPPAEAEPSPPVQAGDATFAVSESSMMDIASLWDDVVQQEEQAKAVAMSPPPPPARSGSSASDDEVKRLANSTSTLFISATINKPDMAQIIFCVSALMHDLIEEAESIDHLADMVADDHEPAASAAGDARPYAPYALWKPRAIFALPGKRSRNEYETEMPGESIVPAEEDISECIIRMHSLMKFSPGCLVVSMIYIERLRRAVGAELLASTWQPTLLVATIVAQKMWEDRLAAVLPYDLSSMCPELTADRLRRLEVDFLNLIDYNITISASVYTTWYFRLVEFCEAKNVRLRPLSQEEAVKLEICTHVYADAMNKDSKRVASSPEGIACAKQDRGRAVLN